MFQIPEDACETRFVHASGPGGQHVNKASTAVELKVYVHKIGLPPGALHRLQEAHRNRINRDGALVIQADQFRSQLNNRKAALERIQTMIDQALIPPKRRVATRPTYSAKKRRLQSKKKRGQVKTNRQKPGFE
jgi:ribosome-associated protein